MASLIDAGTGYSTVADWTDTTPQPDSADSGASLEPPSSYVTFIWPVFTLIGHTTGYDTVADFFDTTPQPNFAASGAALTSYYNSIVQGRYIITESSGSRESWGVVGT